MKKDFEFTSACEAAEVEGTAETEKEEEAGGRASATFAAEVSVSARGEEGGKEEKVLKSCSFLKRISCCFTVHKFLWNVIAPAEERHSLPFNGERGETDREKEKKSPIKSRRHNRDVDCCDEKIKKEKKNVRRARDRSAGMNVVYEIQRYV